MSCRSASQYHKRLNSFLGLSFRSSTWKYDGRGVFRTASFRVACFDRPHAACGAGLEHLLDEGDDRGDSMEASPVGEDASFVKDDAPLASVMPLLIDTGEKSRRRLTPADTDAEAFVVLWEAGKGSGTDWRLAARASRAEDMVKGQGVVREAGEGCGRCRTTKSNLGDLGTKQHDGRLQGDLPTPHRCLGRRLGEERGHLWRGKSSGDAL